MNILIFTLYCYLAALLKFLQSEFVVMVFVHLVKDLFHPFLWRVFVFVDWLLTLRRGHECHH